MPRSRTLTRTPCSAGWSVTGPEMIVSPASLLTLRALEPTGPALAKDPLNADLVMGRRPRAAHACPPACGPVSAQPGLKAVIPSSSRGYVSVPARYEAPPGQASPEGAQRVESSVAAPGTKVPLAGADPGLAAAADPVMAALRGRRYPRADPGGSPRLLQAARGTGRGLRWAYRRTIDGWRR